MSKLGYFLVGVSLVIALLFWVYSAKKDQGDYVSIGGITASETLTIEQPDWTSDESRVAITSSVRWLPWEEAREHAEDYGESLRIEREESGVTTGSDNAFIGPKSVILGDGPLPKGVGVHLLPGRAYYFDSRNKRAWYEEQAEEK